MFGPFSSLTSGLIRKAALVMLPLAGVATMPAPALAHHHGFHVDVNVALPIEVAQPVTAPPPCAPNQVWVEPVYQTVSDRHWVEPVYQTVTERVWVAPVTTQQSQRVYIPDQWGIRDVVVYDAYGCSRIVRQHILIQPAHYESRCVELVQTPGHFEDVQRQQLVCEGHWETCSHQVLVTAGHWEETTPVTVVEPARLEIRLPF